LWLAAHGDDLDTFGQHTKRDRGQRRDGQPGGHDLKLGEPVAHDVADVGSLCQARPDAEQGVAGVRSARDPDLAFELLPPPIEARAEHLEERYGREPTDRAVELGNEEMTLLGGLQGIVHALRRPGGALVQDGRHQDIALRGLRSCVA
jgi:hypothetical protein